MSTDDVLKVFSEHEALLKRHDLLLEIHEKFVTDTIDALRKINEKMQFLEETLALIKSQITFKIRPASADPSINKGSMFASRLPPVHPTNGHLPTRGDKSPQ